jgi:hypothetical protein
VQAPLEAEMYCEHAHPCTVARLAPTGAYVASAGINLHDSPSTHFLLVFLFLFLSFFLSFSFSLSLPTHVEIPRFEQINQVKSEFGMLFNRRTV